MAGAACKVIIDNGIRGLSQSLETVLMSPLVRDRMLPSRECDQMIQYLADIDIATYEGLQVPYGGLRGVMMKLESAGVLTDEVWKVFNKG